MTPDPAQAPVPDFAATPCEVRDGIYSPPSSPRGGPRGGSEISRERPGGGVTPRPAVREAQPDDPARLVAPCRAEGGNVEPSGPARDNPPRVAAREGDAGPSLITGMGGDGPAGLQDPAPLAPGGGAGRGEVEPGPAPRRDSPSRGGLREGGAGAPSVGAQGAPATIPGRAARAAAAPPGAKGLADWEAAESALRARLRRERGRRQAKETGTGYGPGMARRMPEAGRG